jgi:hypothetical protein
VVELRESVDGITFRVRVQPRASRTEVAGEYGNAIRIRLAAPPVDGKANEECIRFIASLLEIPVRDVEIVSGQSSRDKSIRVRNVSAERVRQALKGE